jgi:endoglycosylceramidase
MGRRGNTGSIVAATAGLLALGVLVAGLAGCSGGGDDDAGPAGEPGTPAAPEVAPLPRLHAVRGERPGIFDEDGRQVTLRGVNLNFLAEYARNNDDYDPTLPLTGETWDQIAAEGFDVVRLLVSWSRLEPQPGQLDDGYVDEIRQAVDDAADRGLYVVVDMHQDAWGPYVATPEGVDCPAGQEPSTGWDGAPEWATPAPTGTSSCRGAEGEAKPGSELVVDAWDRFYRDTDGVRGRLVATWGRLVGALGDAPNIAGYDLLNEPGHGRGDTAPPGLLAEFPALGELYAAAIDGIRRGEQEAGIEARPIFFEQSVVGSPPPADFSDDPGLVFAPHLYGGSIIEFLSVDQSWDLALTQAAAFQSTLWIGEYGWFDDPATHPEYVERAARFGVREDGGPSDAPGAEPPPFVPAGSAWWQWTTGCGDPHRIVDHDLEPEGPSWQYRLGSCPDGEDHGVVPEWRTVVTRPYARFAPGWIDTLTSDGAAGTLDLRAGGAEPGQQVELWVPGGGGDPGAEPGDDPGAEPTVDGEGITGVTSTQLGIGWRVTADVEASSYRVTITPGA